MGELTSVSRVTHRRNSICTYTNNTMIFFELPSQGRFTKQEKNLKLKVKLQAKFLTLHSSNFVTGVRLGSFNRPIAVESG